MAQQSSEKRLQARKIQPTAIRMMVLDYMIGQKRAVSLSDLEEHFSRSDRTTLYRTLKTFLEHGLAHQIHDESGSAKYALCAEDCTCSYPDDLHLHFYCSACQNTFCFTEMPIPKFSLPEDFKPRHGNFVITGHCPSCTARPLQ
jgi:Fur family transcriptional regulator, ferric uptake regulator